MIEAVVLAAGLSRRMGQAKLLLSLGDRPVIRLTVERVLASGVIDRVRVVTGGEHAALVGALDGLSVASVVNPNAASGQASSVKAGVAALGPSTEAVLIVLGDQPTLSVDVVRALVETFRRGGKPIVAPRYTDGRGNPVLFGREIFPELLAIHGDQGARSVVERDPHRVTLVQFDFPMPSDIDTPEDYRRLRFEDETG